MRVSKDDLLKHISELRERIQSVESEIDHNTPVAKADSYFEEFHTACYYLFKRMGSAGKRYAERLDEIEGSSGPPRGISVMLGLVKSCQMTVEHDGLVPIESLVAAETFNDLIEQAEHLQSQGYVLAAGAVGRAALECHLRKLCDIRPVKLANPKPTIENYLGALSNAGHISKTMNKQVTAAADIGNRCAHGKEPHPTDAEMEHFFNTVRLIIEHVPLSDLPETLAKS